MRVHFTLSIGLPASGTHASALYAPPPGLVVLQDKRLPLLHGSMERAGDWARPVLGVPPALQVPLVSFSEKSVSQLPASWKFTLELANTQALNAYPHLLKQNEMNS